MVRVLLLLDDYNEMLYLQTSLRKLGIDVETIQNPKKFSEVCLGFNPKIIFLTVGGKTVDGAAICKSLKRRASLPKVCLLRSAGASLQHDEAIQIGADTVLESPVNIKKMIHALSEMADLDEDVLLDKYAKLQAQLQSKSNSDSNVSTQFNLQKSEADYDVQEIQKLKRKETYQKVVQAHGKIEKKSFPRERISQFMKDLRKTPLPSDHVEIEAERLEFVKNLFKKAKG